MFVHCTANILFHADNGETFLVRRGYIGEVPDWVDKTKYFARLVADGVISVPESKATEETPRKPKSAKAAKAE